MLPPELYDRFLDFLFSDRDSLLTCATVCRAFLPCVRYHLFNTVGLYRYRQSVMFECALEADPRASTYVRHLTIRGGQVEPILDQTDAVRKEWESALQIGIPQLLSGFTNMETLRLQGFDFGKDPRLVASICTNLQSLKALVIDWCKFDQTSNTFDRLMTSLPVLNDLTLYRSRRIVFDAEMTNTMSYATIMSLQMMERRARKMSEQLPENLLLKAVESNSCTRLRIFACGVVTPIHQLCAFLTHYGKNLEEVYLTPRITPDSEAEFLLAVTCLLNVKHFTVSSAAPRSHDSRDRMFEVSGIPRFFQSITSRSISHISLGLGCFAGTNEEFRAAWSTVATILRQEERFCGLEQLLLGVPTRFDYMKNSCILDSLEGLVADLKFGFIPEGGRD